MHNLLEDRGKLRQRIAAEEAIKKTRNSLLISVDKLSLNGRYMSDSRDLSLGEKHVLAEDLRARDSAADERIEELQRSIEEINRKVGAVIDSCPCKNCKS